MQLVFGVLALGLNVFGYVPYIRDIIRGRVQPQRVSWVIWMVLVGITAVNQVRNGGGWSSLFVISIASACAIVALLSLRYGVGGSTRLDKGILGLALILMIYWMTVQDTHVSTVLAVAIDAVACLPTLIKTYRSPETETYAQWMISGTAGLIAAFAVTRIEWVLLLYPTYVFVMNGMIVAAKYSGERGGVREWAVERLTASD
jgi:hypothetical protein